MKKKLSRSLKSILFLFIALAVSFSSFNSSIHSVSAQSEVDPAIRPIVFVHGGAGSGAQFQSQAMRFTSNGYPPHYIVAHEYDSSTAAFGGHAERYARLDQLIDKLLEETGAEQIDLIGHSLGTAEMIGYLESSPERATKVAHYVNIDGRTLDHLPGGVPTLALWAEIGGSSDRAITDAKNVTIPGQAHIEVATSKEAFIEMYRFFNDKDPVTAEIVPEPTDQIQLAGKAQIFPQNVPVENATLEIYEVDENTGQRLKEEPEAIYPIGPSGDWGPFQAKTGSSYEFMLKREDSANQRFYFEPFVRSDYMIRLLTSPPSGGISDQIDKSDNHSSIMIQRNMEFFGEGANQDELKVNGVNIVNENNSTISKRISAYFVFDRHSDKENNLNEPIEYFHNLPFMTGVDLYMPASTPPNETISLELQSRASEGKKQVINVPNWASSNGTISVLFNDYVTGTNSEDPDDNKTGLKKAELEIDGLKRTFEYYIPSSYTDNQATPLLFSFHGAGSSGEGQIYLTEFDQIAENEGFIAVFPDSAVIKDGEIINREDDESGFDPDSGVDKSWKINHDQVDDVAFTSAILDYFEENYNIDTNRVYATGMSSGALFSSHLAVMLPDRIAGIGLVTGQMTRTTAAITAEKPKTVVMIMGEDDPLYSADSPIILSNEETIDYWLEANSITTEPDFAYLPQTAENDDTRISRTIYTGGKNNTEVIYYLVEGGGHTWPGGPQYLPESAIGKTSQHMNASEVIWEHLKERSLDEIADPVVDEPEPEEEEKPIDEENEDNGKEHQNDETSDQTDKDGEAKQQVSNGDKLPKTATNMYTFLIIGLVIILVATLLIYKRKRTIEK